MSTLNYGYTPKDPVHNSGSLDSVQAARTGLSKQAVANSVILDSMPTQPGGGIATPAQSTGFGRTR